VWAGDKVCLLSAGAIPTDASAVAGARSLRVGVTDRASFLFIGVVDLRLPREAAGCGEEPVRPGPGLTREAALTGDEPVLAGPGLAYILTADEPGRTGLTAVPVVGVEAPGVLFDDVLRGAEMPTPSGTAADSARSVNVQCKLPSPTKSSTLSPS